ncbi:MAG: PIG-L family deacetylase [Dehalococcoidales bacterium]|nr:PIG-L family deacetylase [Dehalococcoidales bacterium]
MTVKADLLVIAPHADDAEFGIAGTVARWAKEGKNVVYVICTNGDKGTSDPFTNTEELARTRIEEQRAAAVVLGVKDVVFLGYPDQGLEDTAEFRKELVRQIRTYRPECVATTDPYRRYIWHRDHRITGQVTLDAVYPFARDHLAYPDLYAQGYNPHKVKELLCWGTDNPNYWSDITGTFDIKFAALACHKSQVGNRDPQQLYEGLRARAAEAARGQNVSLAEPFYRVEIRM